MGSERGSRGWTGSVDDDDDGEMFRERLRGWTLCVRDERRADVGVRCGGFSERWKADGEQTVEHAVSNARDRVERDEGWIRRGERRGSVRGGIRARRRRRRAEVRVQVSSKDGGRVERGDGVSGARARVSSDARDVRHGWGRWVREFLGRRGEKTIGASRSISHVGVGARVFTERRDFSHREFVRARGSRERQTSRRHLSQIGQRGRGSSEKSPPREKRVAQSFSLSFNHPFTHSFPHASTRVVVVVIVVDDDAR